MYCEDSVYAARVCETLKACVLCKAWGRELTKCDQCQITISVVDMLGNYHHLHHSFSHTTTYTFIAKTSLLIHFSRLSYIAKKDIFPNIPAPRHNNDRDCVSVMVLTLLSLPLLLPRRAVDDYLCYGELWLHSQVFVRRRGREHLLRAAGEE